MPAAAAEQPARCLFENVRGIWLPTNAVWAATNAAAGAAAGLASPSAGAAVLAGWLAAWLVLRALRRGEEWYRELGPDVCDDRAAAVGLGALSLPAGALSLAVQVALAARSRSG